jgi:peptidoglycan/LPS O-acetylase OafA/YrhL
MPDSLVEGSAPRTFLAVRNAHMPALDGLRGIAILSVMAFHFFLFSGIEPTNHFDRAIFACAGFGWAGVDLFFVLSGFLITGILYDTSHQPRFFRNFYWRRALRIFPIYYLFLGFCFVVLPMLDGASSPLRTPVGQQLWQWSYLSNVQIALFGWDGLSTHMQHLWSLAMEEQFYLVWPWLVFFCSRRALLRMCAVMIVGALLLRVWLHRHGMWLPSYVLTPARLDALAVGATLALIVRDRSDARVAERWAKPVLIVTSALLAVLFVMKRGLYKEDAVVGTIGLTLVAGASGAVLLLCLTMSNKLGGKWKNASGTLKFFGKYSYALYLFHQPIAVALASPSIKTMAMPGVGGLPLVRVLGFSTTGLVMSIAAALTSWHLWEKHFLKLKDRIARDQTESLTPN